MNYRMTGSNEYEASRTVQEALQNKPIDEAARVIARVIDAAYRSEQDMVRLKEILNGGISKI